MTNAAGLDPTIFAAAIVTVIAALVGGVIQVISAMSAASDRRDAREERKALRERADTAIAVSTVNGTKADTIIEKAVEIHTLTNSANAKLQAALELVTEKLAASELRLTAMEKTHREVGAALHTPVPRDGHTLEQIEVNTAVAADALVKKS